METWVAIPGYEGSYRISDQGKVQGPRKTLKPSPTSTGRLAVTLCKNGQRKTWDVHKLVAMAFLGPCPEGQEIRHLDGDCLNNVLPNLAYGSRSENQRDSVAHDTHRNSRKTHCPQGHEYAPENTYSGPGRNERQCIKCLRVNSARYKRKKRQVILNK